MRVCSSCGYREENMAIRKCRSCKEWMRGTLAKLTIRVPHMALAHARTIAAKRGQSLNDYLVHIIEEDA